MFSAGASEHKLVSAGGGATLSSQENEIGYLLNRVMHLARGALNEQLAAVGLQPIEWTSMRHIDLASSDGVKLGVDDLAHALGDDRAAISRLLQGLAAKHLIGVGSTISLTAEGKRVLAPLEEMAALTITTATSGFTSDEVDLLVGYLRRMNSNLERADVGPDSTSAPHAANRRTSAST